MELFITTLLAMGIRLATALILCAFGETFSQRSGVLSIGIEGYMAFAALMGFAGSYWTGNPWLGALLAVAAAGAMSLVHGYLCITWGFSQMVSGIGIILFAGGLTSFAFGKIFGHFSTLPKVKFFEVVNVPMFSEIPMIGPILFRHALLTYAAFLLIPLFYFVFYRTKFGLKIRAVGEYAAGSDTMGINVHIIRYICTLLSGVMSGWAGAFLSLGISHSFQEGMIAGRGFIVLAAIVLGNWNPLRVFGACLLFGTVDALQYKMQILKYWGIPYAFWLMLPYIVATGTLVITRKTRQPSELTIPYLREQA